MKIKLEAEYNVTDDGEYRIMSLLADINSQPVPIVGPNLFTHLVTWAYLRRRDLLRKGFKTWAAPSRLQLDMIPLNRAMQLAWIAAESADVNVTDASIRKTVAAICRKFNVVIADAIPDKVAVAQPSLPMQRQVPND